ncbi:hypothetical protein FMM74_022415 [Lachnospiraceae bacterium MD308]|nr:hypothetical protein [Lachnospiraceae bacterium MD308]
MKKNVWNTRQGRKQSAIIIISSQAVGCGDVSREEKMDFVKAVWKVKRRVERKVERKVGRKVERKVGRKVKRKVERKAERKAVKKELR